MDENRVTATPKLEAESIAETDSNQDYELMREYAKQLNGEIIDSEDGRNY
ncbi:hypothetical protein [Gordoniibacillus kamchatkensis]|nr:hypothetical protein [Paenibacillus sp. VKM B-2647]